MLKSRLVLASTTLALLSPAVALSTQTTASGADPAATSRTADTSAAHERSNRAKAPYAPGIIAETAHLTADGVKSRVRFVVPTPQKSVRKYVVRRLQKDSKKQPVVKVCSKASMKNGSGSKGCYVDIGSTYHSTWLVRAQNKAGRASKPIVVLVEGLDGALDEGGDSEGTTQQITVQNSRRQAYTLSVYAQNMLKGVAKECRNHSHVRTGLSILAAVSREAAKKKPNVYSGGAAALAHSAYFFHAGAIDSPCDAFGALVLDLAEASHRAIKKKRNTRVQVFSTWDTSGTDSCTVVTRWSGGKASAFTLNPEITWGRDEQSCWGFWGGMVS